MADHANDLLQAAGGAKRVAAACGVSVDAIRKWRETGRVPPIRWLTVARLSGFPLADVAAARLTVADRKRAA